jgi:GH15 family glucan-1,4-alpha-glucosidase
MYAIDGRPVMREETLDHFEGYLGSRPVRIGHDARTHLQLDIYGEFMDAVYLYDKYGSPIGYDAWKNVVGLVDWVCDHWREKDESIWEVRGGRREFLYSRVMCWVAIDRAIRLFLLSLVRGTGHHLPRHLRALLGPRARLRPAPGRGHV